MSNAPNTSSSLHPVFWIAGIAVTLFSLVGIASLTGMLPSHSGSEPQAVAANAPAAAPAPAAPTASPSAAPAEAPPPATTAAAEPPKPVVRHTSKPRQKLAALPPPEGAGVPPDYAPPAKPAAPACAECGTIAEVRQIKHEGQGTGLGAVGGGLVGGALANNIGQGNGRTLATIAGIVGGGLLGNKIEKSQRETVSYQVAVKMEDGTSRVVNYDAMPPWRIGEPVRMVNGTIAAR